MPIKFGSAPASSLHRRGALAIPLLSAGLCAPALAVRVNPDGHGQALIFPYYTARSTALGNAYVTALAVTNVTSRAKALKVRFLEGRVGTPVFDFNLFLAAYDVWTAGIVGAGAGTGIFTSDNSCTLPKISNTAAIPTTFRNAAYIGDLQGDSLDRTYEGYFEVLEMGTIAPGSTLESAVTPILNFFASNASKPSCAGLPASDVVPATLTKPSGGLIGNASYINVNDGTDFSADAAALSQWSDKVQWSAAGNDNPTLADVSPKVSYVVDAREDRDIAYLSTWNSGRDAVSALFMVTNVRNDFSVEPAIKAATDWVLTLPTKRFYVSAAKNDPPFGGGKAGSLSSSSYICEVRFPLCGAPGYFDRETASPGCAIDFAAGGALQSQPKLCGAASVLTFTRNSGSSTVSKVFGSTVGENLPLFPPWINGWLDFEVNAIVANSTTVVEISRLAPAPGATTIINTSTGQTTTGATVTYFGLPIIGFAVQSYSTNGLPGVSANVLSSYGGVFAHKFARRIEVQQ